MKLFFSLVCTFLFFYNTNAQGCTYTLEGKVTDFHDNTPIFGATLQISNSTKYTTTNFNGYFTLNNLCKEKVVITIKHIACEPKTITVDVTKNSYKDIYMEHHLEQLNEVTVTSNIKKETNTGQESIIKSGTIEKYSSLSLGDALKEVPGVSSINTGTTVVKPIINGMHSSRIITINNGVRLQDQEWGIEHAPNIDINSANQISVIKGAAALAYGGDAIGGVIVLKPEKVIHKDTLYGKTITGFQSNGIGNHISSSLNKNYKSGWFGKIQGAFKKNGDFNAPDYNLTNTGTESKAVSVRFGKNRFKSGFETFYSFINNEIGILRAAHIGNLKNLATAINAPRPLFINDFSFDISQPKQDITHHLIKTKYYKRIKNFGKINLQYDYQNNKRLEFDIRRGGRSVIPAIDLLLKTHTLSSDINIDKNLNYKLNFGVLGRFQDNFPNPDTGVRRLIPDYKKYDFGSYITFEWSEIDNLILDIGLRYDYTKIDALKFYKTSFWESRQYDKLFPDLVINTFRNDVLTNPILNFHNPSASAGLKYTINEKNSFILNYALASRPPNPSELFSDGLHHSAARIEIGDLSITKETSNRVSASYSFNNSKLSIQTDTYYNFINNFIYIVPSPLGIIPLIRGPFPAWNYIQTDASFFGVDLSAKYTINKNWYVHHKSSFIKGKDKLANLPLIDIPAFNTTNNINYTNSKWNNFSASLQSELVLEQNEFPDEFNFTVPIANGEDIFVDLSPPPAYHLVHFQSEVTVPLNKKSDFNIKFSIQNIFNKSYRNYLNRLRFFGDELGRNFKLQLQFNY